MYFSNQAVLPFYKKTRRGTISAYIILYFFKCSTRFLSNRDEIRSEKGENYKFRNQDPVRIFWYFSGLLNELSSGKRSVH